MNIYKYIINNVIFLIETDKYIARYFRNRVSEVSNWTNGAYSVKIRVERIEANGLELTDRKFITQQELDITEDYYYREIADLGIFCYERKKKQMNVQYIDTKNYPFDSYEVVVDTILQFIYLIMLEFQVVPLHSAVLAHENRAIMLFGNSGAGKSTLELSLLCSGFQYFADDIAFMDEKNYIHSSNENILACTDQTKKLVEERFKKKFLNKTVHNIVNKQILPMDEVQISKHRMLVPYMVIFPQRSSIQRGLHKIPSLKTLIKLMEYTISEQFSTSQKILYFKRLKVLSEITTAFEYYWNVDAKDLEKVCFEIKKKCEREL